MKEKDDRYYLVHILECIGNVEDDTSVGRDAFLGNRTLRDAVMRNLQVMAESSIRLSEGLKARFADVEWDELRKFRHVAVHDYIGTDYQVIWLIVTLHLPRLKAHPAHTRLKHFGRPCGRPIGLIDYALASSPGR